VTSVFQSEYAEFYDAIYSEKNYAGECEVINELIKRFQDGSTRTVLDLGCGTGRHAVIFAKRGFEVIGVDQSEAMLVCAQRRAWDEGVATEFVSGDIRHFTSRKTFDAVLMNFNVIGYMARNDDLVNALTTARNNVRPDGLLIADFWYGPAITADPPGRSAREFITSQGTMVRSSSGHHLPNEQACVITIDLSRKQDGQSTASSQEVHRVRYFFPLELELALRLARFKLLQITGFPNVSIPASERSREAAFVAAAVD
jgi:SAM-dependent methyltransferase